MAYGGPKLAGVKWTGLDSFKHELQVLTAGLVDEANAILLESAQAAKADIAAAYPIKSGNLRRGLVLRPVKGIVLAGMELLQKAPHGYIYEHGTRSRETKDRKNRGVMKATPTFIPTAAAYRRSALSQISYRLYWHGATRVTGSADEE
jgi:hypothetical protein